MSSLGLTQDELKAVEKTRQQLSQLSNTINSLKNDVFISNPLPTLDSLQSSTDILERNITAIVQIMAQNDDLFHRVTVHPSTNYPGRTQEGILLQLLRKKAEPDVEAAMDEGRKTAAALQLDVPARREDMEELWAQARAACREGIGEYLMDEADPYTAEEREMGIENVRTGLRRSLDDDDSDEEEEEEEEGQGEEGGEDADLMIIDRPLPPPAPAVTTTEVPGVSLENVLRFATRGSFTG
ncbi:mediator of RNA polymerase II transcription complex subunit 8-domain-containing protein [Xylariaceae sp. FL1272]|nr:mediator of RNA polymerase II transcription complex subunit 8-domain-containing protein [Xylariaceae sp. FL1272]